MKYFQLETKLRFFLSFFLQTLPISTRPVLHKRNIRKFPFVRFLLIFFRRSDEDTSRILIFANEEEIQICIHQPEWPAPRFRSYLSRDNGMHGGTAVADHEDKLGIWKEIENVGPHLQGEGILVA